MKHHIVCKYTVCYVACSQLACYAVKSFDHRYKLLDYILQETDVYKYTPTT